MLNILSKLTLYDFNSLIQPAKVTDIRPDPDLSGHLGIFHTSSQSNGSTSVEYFMQYFSCIPENAPILAYLQTHYPEYLI